MWLATASANNTAAPTRVASPRINETAASQYTWLRCAVDPSAATGNGEEPAAILTATVQSVEIITLKTSASLPIQIRIRRSATGQAVRLRNAIASPSQTSVVDRRCWRAWAKYV